MIGLLVVFNILADDRVVVEKESESRREAAELFIIKRSGGAFGNFLWDHKLKEGFKLKVALILLLQLLLTAPPPLTLHTPQSQPSITEFYLFETIQPLCKEEEGGGGGVEINTINS